MKLTVSLVSGSITFLSGMFLVLFVLPLGLLGASSEKMMNASFVFFTAWVVAAATVVTIAGFLLAGYLAVKTNLGPITSALISIALCLVVGLVLNLVGWVAATVIGNQ